MYKNHSYLIYNSKYRMST